MKIDFSENYERFHVFLSKNEAEQLIAFSPDKETLFSGHIVMSQLSQEELYSLNESQSSEVYAYFENLLKECTAGKREAILALKGIASRYDGSHLKESLPFSFAEKKITNYLNEINTLTLISFKSTYAPGEWSRTFYEGLSRYPVSEFYGRRTVELGCGNGWICLGLAHRHRPEKIWGVDINSRAVLAANINLVLNAYDNKGNITLDEEGKSLLDRVAFQESDLLSAFQHSPLALDRIIGCIPQVLNPELSVLKTVMNSDEYLYSLSNYCGYQGYVEDEFGLGLIAKAIEQSIALLRPTGKLILNLGGRPGEEVLRKLMTRRGLGVRKIWQTINKQDSDTSIEGLVEIERETGHQFEFFMHPYSSTSVCASTAQAFAAAGGELYHAVSVYEATLRFPSQLKRIFETLNEEKYQGVRANLDLSDPDADIAEERFSVLADLVSYLDQQKCLPYGNTAGIRKLLKCLSEFFSRYYFLPVQSSQCLVSPTRGCILANILYMYAPQTLLINSSMQNLLPHEWSLRKNLGSGVIHAPEELNLTLELIATLKPQLVITRLTRNDAVRDSSFASLLQTCKQTNSLLVLDISEIVELSSTPQFVGALASFEGKALPNNLYLLCGLIQNRVYKDLQLGLVIHGNGANIELLADAAEVSYSRAPLLTQRYYLQILEELLNFHFQRTSSNAHRPQNQTPTLCRVPAVSTALTHAALAGNKLPFDEDSVRLDYGENELPMPPVLKQSLLEALVQSPEQTSTLNLTEALGQCLESRFGIRHEYSKNIIYANGVAEIFTSIVRQLKSRKATILFPSGGYGYFEAVLQFYQIPYRFIPTYRTSSFKLSQSELQKALRETKGQTWLYFNSPVNNPTGAIYSNAEIRSIVATCQEHNCSIIMDTIFTGLEFPGNQNSWDIKEVWDTLALERSGISLLLLGGVSKEFAAAGLRFGYVISPKASGLTGISEGISGNPHKTLLFGLEQLYRQLAKEDKELCHSLALQKKELAYRAEKLSQVLVRNGWEVLEPQGGLFLLATPVNFLGHKVSHPKTGTPVTLTADMVAETLFYSTGLAINGASWTGIPDFCRFVLSTEESAFTHALNCIERFPICLNYLE